MDSNWIDYKCKSGQTMFLYNKVTGEHKWPPGHVSGDSTMHGEPVQYKETRSIAIQTDDFGCSNGCTSMYMSTFLHHLIISSETIHPQKQVHSQPVLEKQNEFQQPCLEHNPVQRTRLNLQQHNIKEVLPNPQYTQRSLERPLQIQPQPRPQVEPRFQQHKTTASVTVQQPQLLQRGPRQLQLKTQLQEQSLPLLQESNTTETLPRPERMDQQQVPELERQQEHQLQPEPQLRPQQLQLQEQIQEQFCPKLQEPNTTETLPRPQRIKQEQEIELKCQQEHHVQPQALLRPQQLQLQEQLQVQYLPLLQEPNTTETLPQPERMEQQQEPQLKCRQEHQDQLKSQPSPHRHQFDGCVQTESDPANNEPAHGLEERCTMVEMRELEYQSSPSEVTNMENGCSVGVLACGNSTQPNKEHSKCPHDGCQMKFMDDESLIAHFRSHTEGKGVPCGCCERMFPSIRHLSVHMRIHKTGDAQPFECLTCSKRFSRKFNFERHLKIHRGIKPFQCPSCLKMFSEKANLKKHLNSLMTTCTPVKL